MTDEYITEDGETGETVEAGEAGPAGTGERPTPAKNLDRQFESLKSSWPNGSQESSILTPLIELQRKLGDRKLSLSIKMSMAIAKAVQIPIDDWKNVSTKLRKYEQALRIRSDLKEAFEQVASLKAQKGPKQSLAEFLCEI